MTIVVDTTLRQSYIWVYNAILEAITEHGIAPTKAEIARALQQHVWPLLSAGKIKPVIFKTLPLEQAAQGHAMMEAGEQIGKIILTTV